SPPDLRKTATGELIFAYQGFVFQLNPQTLKITLLWKSANSDLLPISSLFLTENNTLWIGVSGDGLYKVDLYSPGFHHIKYQQNYVVDILKGSLQIEDASIPANWTAPSFPYGLRTFNRADTLFIVNEFGFGSQRKAYHVSDNILKPLALPEMSDESCFFGFAGHGEHIWAIDRDGWLFRWDSVSAVPEKTHAIPIHSGEDRDDTRIVDLAADSKSQWVITKPGVLFQIQSESLTNTYYPGSGNSTFVSIKQVPVQDSILWIGSLGDGLIRWNKERKTTTYRFSKKDGLADNKIASLIFDTAHNLWLSTFNGISKYDRKTASFTSYNKSAGMEQTEFNRHHAFLLPDGKISFGGSLGYVIFDPLRFGNDLSNPQINLSALTINGEHPAFSADSIYLDAPINSLNELRLPYHKNSFVIELASNTYNKIAETKFRYSVSDYTNGWVNLNNQRTVRIDQLPPGSYTLAFNVSNSQGTWSKHRREIKLIIASPPWLTWWAFALYAGLVILLAYLYWKSYRKRLIRQQEEAFNKREAKRLAEMDQMKTRFFSNITHEFRTPLTLILSPIERHLQSEEVTGKIRKILESSYRNANQLLGLVNQLLDIAKIESGYMQSHKSVGNLVAFTQEIVGRFEEKAIQKSIKLHFEAHNANGTFELDKMNLERVLQNLLSNAVKFTPTGGEIWVCVAVDTTSLMRLEVKDNGIGIKPEAVPHLFDRFFQADDQTTRAHEGTGIGLALVKELTELMGGRVNVQSTPGQGTSFQVDIPVTQLAADEEQPPEVPTAPDHLIRKQVTDSSLVILVVEDNDELRAFMMESLAAQYTVLGASNGINGWKMIQSELPDLVISDLMMPQMNGYELCQKSKSDLRTAHIQFIMLTAKASQEAKVQ
ncbi:MAG: ATP-binding protein, partial [Bacteroidota bacterium]